VKFLVINERNTLLTDPPRRRWG